MPACLRRGFGLAALVFACHAGAAEAPDLTLSLRADAWSGTRTLDEQGALARGSAWGRLRWDLGDAGKLVADGWLAAQSHGGDSTPHARLREAYWQLRRGPVDLKVGRQLVVWGRADGLNPTDNLSPRDFTLLVPEDIEQRRGNDALQLGVETGLGTLTAVAFARAASHTLPLEALPFVTYDVQAAARRAMWALKFEMNGDGIDGSVSWFDGQDPLPDLALKGLGPAGLQVAVRNQPLRVLGADLSLTRGSVVWRAEAAWMNTASGGADDFFHKKPRLWVVAGAEWPLTDHVTLGLQGTVQHVHHFRSPDTLDNPAEREVAARQAALANQTAATQVGAVWRLAGRWFNDTLWLEASGVVLNHPHSTLWRTRLSYALNDRLQLLAGTDHASGPQHSLWGQLRRNRLGYVQLRAGF